MKKNSLFLFCCLVIVSTTWAQLPSNIKQQPGNAPVLKTAPVIKISPVVTQTVTVRPVTINNLCPTERLSGDHEFGKNELHVEVSVSYQGDNNRDNVLMARIFISASEFGGDRSAVRQAFLVPVYTAPAGFVIRQVLATNRSAAFTFETRDGEKPKMQLVNGCYTYQYDLSRASLGFDLDQHMLTGMTINSRNMYGDDFSESAGGCGCGFKIQSIGFIPFDVLIESKKP